MLISELCLELYEYQADLRRLYGAALPVEYVVLKVAIARTELKIFEDGFILTQIQGIKHIRAYKVAEIRRKSRVNEVYFYAVRIKMCKRE